MKKTISIKLSPKEIKECLNSLTIICDTREKKDNHIKTYFDNKNIKYINKKLDFGDYSLQFIYKNEIIIFEKDIVIERKANLEELSNNFTKTRKQLENELIRKKDARFILLIEKASYSQLASGNYATKYPKKSFVATLNTFKFRYNIEVEYINPLFTWNYIYYLFHYYLYNFLKS